MALAPRKAPSAPPAPSALPASKPRTVATKDGKAKQRAANKAAGNVTRAGSSGKALFTARYPQLEWLEVEDVADHVCDIAGQFTQSQVGASGYIHQSIAVPLSYAHATLSAHLASRDSMVFLRVYVMSHERFQAKMNEEAEAAALALAKELGLDGLQGSLDEAGT